MPLPQNYLQVLWDGLTIERMFLIFVGYFFVIWVALIIWVTRDISGRTRNIFYQLVCVLLIIFGTPLAIFLYLLIRPKHTLFESYYEDVENNLDVLQEIVQERLVENGSMMRCPNCESLIEKDFVICPECHEDLKHSCSSCGKSIREGWDICPYCTAPQEVTEADTQKTEDKTTTTNSKTPQKTTAQKKSPAKTAQKTPAKSSSTKTTVDKKTTAKTSPTKKKPTTKQTTKKTD